MHLLLFYYRDISAAPGRKRVVNCHETSANSNTNYVKTIQRTEKTKALDSSDVTENGTINEAVAALPIELDASSPTNTTSLPRAAPRRVFLMREPPPPPPKPIELRQQFMRKEQTCGRSCSVNEPHDFLKKKPFSTYNKRKKKISTNSNDKDKDIDNEKPLSVSSNDSSLSKFLGSLDPNNLEEQAFDIYANTIGSTTKPSIPIPIPIPSSNNIGSNISEIIGNNNGSANYSLLLCNGKSTTTSPLAMRKREKLLHRFSDAATLGRKIRRKKENSRTCRSMTETIEMLADPVIEDDLLVSKTNNYSHFDYASSWYIPSLWFIDHIKGSTFSLVFNLK